MKIFEATERDFIGYGLGPLPDALSAEITDELNGEFSLSVVYPEQGFNADKLATGNIIFTQARPSDTVGEPFRIREVENSIDKTIKVTAEHISYDMNYIVFNGQINQSVTGIENACHALNDYRTSNGILRIWYDGIDNTLPTVFNISQIRMLSEAFASGEGSLLATFGGDARYQYRPDLQRELVYICARRGVDRDIDIAYGFNMMSFLRVLDNGEQISHVRAYVERDNGGTLERAVEDFVLDADLPTRWMLINVSDAVAWGATRAEIEAAVTAKLIGRDPTKVIETIQTQIVPGIALGIDETQIDVGDSLKVSYPQLGISGRIRIVKAVFNKISGHYDSIELGTIERNVADTIAGLSTNQTQAGSGSGSGDGADPATVPARASIDAGGLISFKNSGGTTLFTLQLPIYGGA